MEEAAKAYAGDVWLQGENWQDAARRTFIAGAEWMRSLAVARELRPSCADRFREIRELVEAAKGEDPFGTRKRDRVTVCRRQCIWRLLVREGYHSVEIGKVTGYDHSTIWWGVSRLDGYIEAGDWLSVTEWNELKEIVK